MKSNFNIQLSLDSKTKNNLYQEALKVRSHAYAPYSGYHVGASVLWSNGHITTGVNVENASYGATVCAERNAIFSGIAQTPDLKIKAICVVTDQANPWPPCGLCRQVIAEFALSDCLIVLGNTQLLAQEIAFKDLFPMAFEPKHLKA